MPAYVLKSKGLAVQVHQ